ncbi:MAG: ABC transporter ATP-binding protein [Acetatifactor sp.]|nr:ABC transporter ATP-binding protein [Acetatifactor sp.]
MENYKQNHTPAICLSHLSKQFGEYQAVRDLSLEVGHGEIFGFLGLNGAGKSTTIKMMLSLLAPSSGSVYMLGTKVNSTAHKLWEQVGYLEDATYYPGLTVAENLDITRRMQMISDPKSIDRVIEQLGLSAYRDRKAKHLSLGNKQRLGLAKAMIHQPRILILDEPINGLDPAGVVEIRKMLLDLSRNHGVTVFISSHQLEELSKLVDRIGIIHEGKLIQEIEMTHLEQSLEKHLVLDGQDKDAIGKLLNEHGLHFEQNSEGNFVLKESSATEHPDEIARFLVQSGQALTQLNTVTEDLEGYFLRMIHNTRRVYQ